MHFFLPYAHDVRPVSASGKSLFASGISFSASGKNKLPLVENVSAPYSKTSRSFSCGTELKFSLAKSELCEETPYLHLVHLCFLNQYSLQNKLKVHSEVRHSLASASKDLCQLAF